MEERQRIFCIPTSNTPWPVGFVGRNLVFETAVSILTRHGITAGSVQYIWHPFAFKACKAVRRHLIDRWKQWLQPALFDLAEDLDRYMQRGPVDTPVFALQPSRKGTPHIIDAGDGTGAEEVLLHEADRILDGAFALRICFVAYPEF